MKGVKNVYGLLIALAIATCLVVVAMPSVAPVWAAFHADHTGPYEDMKMWRPEGGGETEGNWPNELVANDQYRVMANFYNTEIPWPATQTMRAYTDWTTFDVIEFSGDSYNPGNGQWIDPRHWPSSFPAIYKGCHWTQCTNGSGFNEGGPLPMRVWDFASMQSYWEISVISEAATSGVWNAAYDIWLDIGSRPYEWRNQWDSKDGPYDNLPEAGGIVTQPFGTEIMIWTNYKGYRTTIVPAGGIDDDNNPATLNVPNGVVNIGGEDWDLWIGKGTNDQNATIQWNMVSFIRSVPSTVFNFDTKAFVDYILTMNNCAIAYDATGHPTNVDQSVNSGIAPCAAPHWWIASVQAGFEIWADGVGLTSESFSVRPMPVSMLSVSGRTTEDGTTRPIFFWLDHFQVYKTNVVCAVEPTVTYEVTGDAWDKVNNVPLPGTNTVTGDMDVVYVNGTTYDFYAVVEPMWDAGIHGNANVVVTVDCNGTITQDTTPMFVDPSGAVRTVEGTPISGATVTLYRSETQNGTYVVAASGYLSTTNKTNPDLTDESGSFGWDVLPGYYKVRAEAAGCYAPGNPSQAYVETGALPVPPPVFNLDLRMECPDPNDDDPTLPVAITVINDWGTGYCVNATVTNNTSAAVDWAAKFPVDGTIYDAWNFTYVPTTGGVIARGVDWNRTLQPGESTHDVGFCANRNGGSSPICQVSYKIRNQWNVGFTADLTIKNISAAPVNGWTLGWTFPNGQNVYEAWNSSIVMSGPPNASVKNAAWNASIAPGQTVGLGFNGHHFGANGVPSNFTLNGQPCTLVP